VRSHVVIVLVLALGGVLAAIVCAHGGGAA
jgi:hypothetical protein